MADQAMAHAIFGRIQAEMERTLAAWSRLTGNRAPLEANPALARTLRSRLPYLDPLNHLQVELLRRYRSGDSAERVRRGIHITINGIAAGLRNSG
jgi:phosphoenolpyruvate carboxylase